MAFAARDSKSTDDRNKLEFADESFARMYSTFLAATIATSIAFTLIVGLVRLFAFRYYVLPSLLALVSLYPLAILWVYTYDMSRRRMKTTSLLIRLRFLGEEPSPETMKGLADNLMRAQRRFSSFQIFLALVWVLLLPLLVFFGFLF
jgi:hypothetical protein